MLVVFATHLDLLLPCVVHSVYSIKVQRAERDLIVLDVVYLPTIFRAKTQKERFWKCGRRLSDPRLSFDEEAEVAVNSKASLS